MLFVQPRQHVLAVADTVIDERGMRDFVERRTIGITLQRPDRAFAVNVATRSISFSRACR